jgi:hypothetical protein
MMLAMSALRDVGTGFFTPLPGRIVGISLQLYIVTINIIGARPNLNMVVIIRQHPINEIC